MQKKKACIKAVPCEIWSRIVGYYRPVQNWNKGKKEEFKDRKHISLSEEKRSLVNQDSSTSPLTPGPSCQPA